MARLHRLVRPAGQLRPEHPEGDADHDPVMRDEVRRQVPHVVPATPRGIAIEVATEVHQVNEVEEHPALILSRVVDHHLVVGELLAVVELAPDTLGQSVEIFAPRHHGRTRSAELAGVDLVEAALAQPHTRLAVLGPDPERLPGDRHAEPRDGLEGAGAERLGRIDLVQDGLEDRAILDRQQLVGKLGDRHQTVSGMCRRD